MSWSFAVKALRNEAELKFKAACTEQPVHNESAGPVLDLIAAFAIDAAKLVGSDVADATLYTYGHVDRDGYGSYNVSFSVSRETPPVAPPAPAPPPTPAKTPAKAKK